MKLIALTSPRYSDITKLYLQSLQFKPDDTFTLFSFDEKGDEDFGTANYNLTTKRMMEICWKTMKEMKDGELFMYTDSDMIFRVPFSDFTCGDDDIRFQEDKGTYNLCLGFFVARVSPKIVKLFENIYNATNETTNCQIAINQFMGGIKYSFFPRNDVVGYGLISNDKIWNGEDFEIPPCKVFHANYTIGLENKLKLMHKAIENTNKFG